MKSSFLLSLDDALAQLLVKAQPLKSVTSVDTFTADGRVLAEDLIPQIQVPSFDNSAMDGYALRVADLDLNEGVLKVGQQIFAGQAPSALDAGYAARIFTGAPVPMGADAVVMQEEVTLLDDGAVRFIKVPTQGQCIRRKGEDIEKGMVLLAKGTRLDPASLGLAASIGLAQLKVSQAPKVALFSTGDELVMPGDLAPHQLPLGAIFNSNRFFLRSLLERLGCEVSDMGNVPDDAQKTIAALSAAAVDHDLILSSGGVSVGEADFVKPAVQALGELQLWSLSMKPGKPFAYGYVRSHSDASRQAHFIGLPGNPVSSLVTFLLLVRPFILAIQGCSQLFVPPISMRADFVWSRADKRREFLRVKRNNAGGLDLFPNQSSGVLTSAVWGDGLVDNLPSTTIAVGDTVNFLPFNALMS
jgi:molybdopterin molybdotransferase